MAQMSPLEESGGMLSPREAWDEHGNGITLSMPTLGFAE